MNTAKVADKTTEPNRDSSVQYDAIVVGVSGLCPSHRLGEMT